MKQKLIFGKQKRKFILIDVTTWHLNHLNESDFAETWLSSWIAWICRGAAWAVGNANWAIAIASVGVVLVLGGLHALNQPRYTTAESLPEASQASTTLAKIDGQFAGAPAQRASDHHRPLSGVCESSALGAGVSRQRSRRGRGRGIWH